MLSEKGESTEAPPFKTFHLSGAANQKTGGLKRVALKADELMGSTKAQMDFC